MDRRATRDFDIPIRELMESAGRATADEIRRWMSDGRVTFVCGKGNNGGDGLAAARFCHRFGMSVDCLVACNQDELGSEAAVQCSEALQAGVPVIFVGDSRYDPKLECVGCRDLLVDALLGTGASGEARGETAKAIAAINRSGVPVLSIDVPSGIECDTGAELGDSVWATRTITFGLPKPFLFQSTGLEHAGNWTVADIGFPGDLLDEPTDAYLVDCEMVAGLMPERMRASHKGDNGHIVIVAGSRAMPGAATMAAKSAIRSGAGLVTVASIPYVCEIVASHVPECTFQILPEHDGAIASGAADLLAEVADQFQSAVFGPGLGQSSEVQRFLSELWEYWSITSLVDADALNAIAAGVSLPQADCVLTPHPGEMSRLLEASVAEILADRFGAVRQSAQKFNRCTLLKGPHSLVAEQGMPVSVNRTGNSGMASGGMGDVLSGVIAALLGQSVPAYYAASSGMYWHGLAGDICAQTIGVVGYSAMDVANALPMARAKIVSSCDYENCCSS